MTANFSYYKGRRVLLTGHTGFKGTWLATWLQILGAKVCGISLAPDTDPSMFQLSGIAANMESHQFDIADSAQLKRTILAFQPEIIFHLAAQSLVKRSYDQPEATFATNVMGTGNLLEAARGVSSVKAILVITSDKVYRNQETGRAFVEDDPLGGNDPYSASKACAEIVTQSWRASFYDHPGAALIATARAGNVFGGGDWCADRLLPDIARAISAGTAIVLRNPGAVRPWQYVLEALSGYLMLGIRLGTAMPGFAQAWNFGPLDDGTIDVADFTHRVIRAWGQGTVELRPDPNAPKEAKMLRLDSSKSVKALGWKPVLAMQEALEWSVDWYRTVLADPSRAYSISEKQLLGFSERLEKIAPP